MVVCNPWNMCYSGGASRVLTKQRNGGSEIQGAAETVVVGPRVRRRRVDSRRELQLREYEGVRDEQQRVHARGIRRKLIELGVASVVRNAGAASAIRVAGSEDGDAHHVLDRLVLEQKGYG
uniref:Uncharacterized protein n=1 Tax=Oryza meridionalis TaxID=40149 RepID=A0A0E0EKN1_9ORYZ